MKKTILMAALTLLITGNVFAKMVHVPKHEATNYLKAIEMAQRATSQKCQNTLFDVIGYNSPPVVLLDDESNTPLVILVYHDWKKLLIHTTADYTKIAKIILDRSYVLQKEVNFGNIKNPDVRIVAETVPLLATVCEEK